MCSLRSRSTCVSRDVITTGCSSCATENTHKKDTKKKQKNKTLKVALRPSGVLLVSMKGTCPEDVNKTFMGQAKDAHWKNLTKKHEFEELRERV